MVDFAIVIWLDNLVFFAAWAAYGVPYRAFLVIFASLKISTGLRCTGRSVAKGDLNSCRVKSFCVSSSPAGDLTIFQTSKINCITQGHRFWNCTLPKWVHGPKTVQTPSLTASFAREPRTTHPMADIMGMHVLLVPQLLVLVLYKSVSHLGPSVPAGLDLNVNARRI